MPEAFPEALPEAFPGLLVVLIRLLIKVVLIMIKRPARHLMYKLVCKCIAGGLGLLAAGLSCALGCLVGFCSLLLLSKFIGSALFVCFWVLLASAGCRWGLHCLKVWVWLFVVARLLNHRRKTCDAANAAGTALVAAKVCNFSAVLPQEWPCLC